VPQSFACLHYHLIFSTKNRAPLITEPIRDRLNEYLGGIIRNSGGRLLAAGGMPDHLHLLTSLDKQQSISDALRTIKSNSSGWVHETFPERAGFAWQAGYGAFSVSYSNIPEVSEYIANQAEHHRSKTFQEEFLAFLKRHDVEFDERYLWD
jgi:putative transposase